MTKAKAAALVSAPPAGSTADPPAVRDRFIGNWNDVLGFFGTERAEQFRAMVIAAVARQHLLILGPPGTAKSLLVETFARQFHDAEYRRELLTRQTTEADVLAYLDVPTFAKSGDYRYKHEGKLPEGHFAFVDECFKASGSLLNALLTWLNERTARGGFASPLVSAIGASNEMGEDESVAALEDRFLIRFWVSALEKSQRRTFLAGRANGDKPPQLATVSLADLAAVQALASTLPVDDEVLDALCGLVDSLAALNVAVSDRRIGQCVDVLRAVAWLDGDSAVELEHLDFLQHVLWRRPEEREVVKQALSAIGRGIVGDVRNIVDAALRPFHEAHNRLTADEFSAVAIEHLSRLHDAGIEVKEKFAGKISGRTRERVASLLKELAEAHKVCVEASKKLSV